MQNQKGVKVLDNLPSCVQGMWCLLNVERSAAVRLAG